MSTTLVPATPGDEPLIRDLLQPYLAELSSFAPMPRGPRGDYTYPYLAHYWQDPDRFPFLILMETERITTPAGFLLIRKDRDPANGKIVMEVAEIYIEPAYRRRRAASMAIRDVLRYFAGESAGCTWRIGIYRKNTPALGFWRRLIAQIAPAYCETEATVQSMIEITFEA